MYIERELIVVCTLTSIMYCTCEAYCEAIWRTLGNQLDEGPNGDPPPTDCHTSTAMTGTALVAK